MYHCRYHFGQHASELKFAVASGWRVCRCQSFFRNRTLACFCRTGGKIQEDLWDNRTGSEITETQLPHAENANKASTSVSRLFLPNSDQWQGFAGTLTSDRDLQVPWPVAGVCWYPDQYLGFAGTLTSNQGLQVPWQVTGVCRYPD